MLSDITDRVLLRRLARLSYRDAVSRLNYSIANSTRLQQRLKLVRALKQLLIGREHAYKLCPLLGKQEAVCAVRIKSNGPAAAVDKLARSELVKDNPDYVRIYVPQHTRVNKRGMEIKREGYWYSRRVVRGNEKETKS